RRLLHPAPPDAHVRLGDGRRETADGRRRPEAPGRPSPVYKAAGVWLLLRLAELVAQPASNPAVVLRARQLGEVNFFEPDAVAARALRRRYPGAGVLSQVRTAFRAAAVRSVLERGFGLPRLGVT